MLTILQGDAIEQLRTLPNESVHCCVTSPPYWGLRDYSTNGQLGLEKTPDEYVAKMVEVFREVRRVLRKDGTLWLNLGDSYAGSGKGAWDRTDVQKEVYVPGMTGRKVESEWRGLKPKDLCGIPWRVAFALQADGWWLRSDTIWSKPNPMPESVTDRPTKAHEYLFLLTKSANYFYDAEAIKESQAESQIGRIRSDLIGGTSWKERQQHGQGGEYKTNSGRRDNGGEMALFGEQSEGGGKRGIGGETLCESANMVRQNESAFVESVRRESVLLNRNKRSVWTVATAPYPEAHFATYPPDLIKPCILAGTSAKGCCAKCGSPWERIVESEKSFQSGSGRAGNMPDGKQDLRASETNSTPDVRMGPVVSTKTVGWQPTCKCLTYTWLNHPFDFAPIPCTVLDPFAGSGTTGAVALELGRKAILIELNPKYVQLIRDRCNITPGLQLA